MRELQIKTIEEIRRMQAVPKLQITPEQQVKLKADMEAEKVNPTKLKVFKWPWNKKSKMNKTTKQSDQIIVFMITSKKTLDIKTTKIFSGNFFVINNRVYEFDPSTVLSMGKYKLVVARDYDRKCVSVNDYQELLLKDFASNNPGNRVNVNDPVLIKALIQARLDERKPIGGNKIWIIVVVIIAIIAGFLWYSSRKVA